MARFGKTTNKPTENGNKAVGDRDIDYLNKVSRENTEDNHNTWVLFFQTDWAQSKKNFYGELTIKRFVNSEGIKLRGSYKLTEGDEQKMNGVLKKTKSMIVSVYTQQFEELSIEPTIGDYFAIGKRYYYIYDKTINDVGKGNILMKRERVMCDFYSYEASNESIQRHLRDQLGTPDDEGINNPTGSIIE